MQKKINDLMNEACAAVFHMHMFNLLYPVLFLVFF